MKENMIGKNIQLLRDRKGLSQKALANTVGVSLSALKKIENGTTREPRYTTLKNIARELDESVTVFFQPVPRISSARFRSIGPIKGRELLLVKIGRWLKGYNQVEELINEKEPFRLSVSEPSHGTRRESIDWARKQAAEVRKQMGLKPHEPIHDIYGLLENQGVKLCSAISQSSSFFGLSVSEKDGGPAIVVNTWSRITVERWIFTSAHELAHLVLHQEDYDTEEAEENELHEIQANTFASHFLMPEEVFKSEWEETEGLPLIDRVMKVKGIFNVSYKTVLWRLVENGSSPLSVWDVFRREYEEAFGEKLAKQDEPNPLDCVAFNANTPEPDPSKEPFALNRFHFTGGRLVRLVKKALQQEEITPSRAAELLDISLVELRDRAKEWG